MQTGLRAARHHAGQILYHSARLSITMFHLAMMVPLWVGMRSATALESKRLPAAR